MFSLSHDFKPDLLWILLADIWKKQCIWFINPDLLLVLKRENHSAALPTMCDLCRCRWIGKAFTVVVCSKWTALVSWNYLNLLKVQNFKQHLRLLKRKTKLHVAVMSNTVQHYHSLLSDIYGDLTSTFWIFLTQNLSTLAASLTVHLTVKIKLIWT